MKTLAAILASPLVCVGLLAGVTAEQRYRVTPQDAEPYHKGAAEGILGVPPILGSWLGKDNPVPAAAVKLLRSNVILSRRYEDYDIKSYYRGRRAAEFLIVHCSDSRDMVGHYPPICYRGNGQTQVYSAPRDWKVGDLTITGMEYHFVKTSYNAVQRNVVYNFMIAPGKDGGKICRDMNGVMDAAEDYQQRHYGASQFQVLMSADYPELQRDDIFAALITPNLRLIHTLLQTSNPEGQP